MARLLHAGRSTAVTGGFVPFEETAVEASISDRFEQMVARHSGRLAVKDGAHAITYSNLNQAANRVARAILEREPAGTGPVALLCNHGASPLVGLLAILKAGRFFLPLDPSYPQARLGYMLEDSQTTLIIAEAATARLGISLIDSTMMDKEVLLLNIDEIEPDLPSGDLDLPIPPGTNAYLHYTSGSTGRPRGVLQTQRNVLKNIKAQTSGYRISSSDRMALHASVSYAASCPIIFGSLLNGASIFPFDLKERGLAPLAAWLAQERITVLHLVPTVFRHFAQTLTGDETFPHLRLLKLGGEAVYRQDVDLYKRHFGPNCVLRVGMATTETGSLCWYFVDKRTEVRNSIVPIGYPMEGKEILLLGDDREPVQTGEVGEIAVRSRYLSPGYWRRPDLTSERFLSDPHDSSKRIYLTGDLGRMRADGCLEYLGRKDTQVKICGLRIELGEVENSLLALDSVREVAVAAWPGEEHELRLVAYVVPSGETAPRSERLRAALANTLPAYMIPSTFVLLDRLPLLPNGKLDRQALPAPAPDQNHPTTSEQPFPDELESQLVEIWQDTLDIRPIGVSDDFFEMGGHSLQAMLLVLQIERELDQRLPPTMVFQTPTIKQLADVIRQNDPDRQWSTLVPLQPRGSRPPLFLVHGIGGGVFGYAELARLQGPEQPVFGLQGRGMNGVDEPHRSIPEMAAHYIDVMRTTHPDGPYHLGGYCYGGIVAYEMACQLAARGEQVGLLAILEGYALNKAEARRDMRQPRVMLAFLRNLPLWLGDYLARRYKLLRTRPQNGARSWWPQIERDPNEVLLAKGLHAPAIEERVLAAHRQAIRAYRFPDYPERATLFRVRAMSLFRAYDDALGWRRVAKGGVEIKMVSGAHYNILEQPHVQDLASALEASLDQVRT